MYLKIYTELKLYFTRAHTELRATDTTTNELGYHSASAMVRQIVKQLRVVGIYDTTHLQTNPPPMQVPRPYLPTEQEPGLHPAPNLPPTQDIIPLVENAVIPTPPPDPIMLQMLAQMQQMQQQLDDQINKNFQNGRGTRVRGIRGVEYPAMITEGEIPREVRKYCWTHGSYVHTSTESET